MTEIKVAGIFVSWALPESLDHETLKEGFTAAGIESLTPETRSTVAALRHVLARDYCGRGRVLTSVQGAQGVFIVSEAVGEDVDAQRSKPGEERDIAQANIQVREVGRAWVAKTGGVPTVEASGAFNLQHLRAAVAEAEGSVDQRAMSMSLTKALEGWHAVRLREAGGAYFLPAKYQDRWEALRDSAAQSGLDGGKARLAMARIVSDSDAGQAILAGLTVEIGQKVADIQKAITSGEVGEKRLGTLASEANALRETIRVYEELLGSTLEGLHEQCRNAVVAAGDAAALAMTNKAASKAAKAAAKAQTAATAAPGEAEDTAGAPVSDAASEEAYMASLGL